MSVIIPVITFIVGLAIGAIGMSLFIKKKMSSIMGDPKQIANIAKSMGYNLNQKQLSQVNSKLKGQSNNKKKKKKKK